MPNNDVLTLYRSMFRLRRTEETLAELYKEQMIRTPAHFGIGQEGIAAGVCEALRVDDVIYSHHRCHNHYLAKGGDLTALISELLGRIGGCSKGRGGSVHLTDRKAGVIATSAILGQGIATAVGSALSFSMDGVDRVATTFFGDAAVEEGIFYESLNYAAIHKLPVLFVCENNLYSTESDLSTRQPQGTKIVDRVQSFKVEATTVDGNDAFAVCREAVRAVAACRANEGPQFIEAYTYRWLEHVGPFYDYELERTYRSREELELWMDKCPIKRLAANLLESGEADHELLDEISREVESEIAFAVEAAKNSPWPEPGDIFENVYG